MEEDGIRYAPAQGFGRKEQFQGEGAVPRRFAGGVFQQAEA